MVTCPAGCGTSSANTCPFTTPCYDGQCNPTLASAGHFCAQTGRSTCSYQLCPKGMTAKMCRPRFYELSTQHTGLSCPIARNQGGLGSKFLPSIMRNKRIPRNLDIQCATMCAVNRVSSFNANEVAKPQCARNTPEFSTCCCRGAKVAFEMNRQTGQYALSKCNEYIPIKRC